MTPQPVPSAPLNPAKPSSLPGINVMIMGASGSGKTDSVGQLTEIPGLDVFYFATEAGLESLLGHFSRQGKPIPENLHWMQVLPTTTGFAQLAAVAAQVNTMTLDMLAKLPDTTKTQHKTLDRIYAGLSNFVDERTGKSYGAVDSWGTDRVLVVDSLSGLNRAVMSNTVGGKVVRSQAEWGMAQAQLENTLFKFTDGCRCHFVMLAHIEREVDQVLGGVKIMPSTLGKALAPKIPAMFSELLYAERVGAEFKWSTANPQVDTKSRYLGIGNFPQSFAPLFKEWQARGGVFAA